MTHPDSATGAAQTRSDAAFVRRVLLRVGLAWLLVELYVKRVLGARPPAVKRKD